MSKRWTAIALVASSIVVAPISAQERLKERQPGLQVVEPDEQDRDLRMTPVVRAVQKAADSVVSIYVNHEVAMAGSRAPNRNVTEGQGSGVILDDTGFVITNWHVIAIALGDNRYSVECKLKDGRSLKARILSHSPEHDLALLQLQLEPKARVTPVSIGRSDSLMVGETVIAIGNPQGHANTVTSGVLSAIGRSIRVQAPDGQPREYTGLLQTDAAINQGNSGGALLDITGRLVGINNAMAMGAENIGFAIPVDTVREVFETQLLSSGSLASSADAPWLGFEVEEKAGAVVVKQVVRGSPAFAADIRIGDVVDLVSGEPIKTRIDFVRRLLTADGTRPFAIRLRRGSDALDAELQPWPRAAGAALAMTGIGLEEVRADEDRALAERASRTFYRGSNNWRVPLFAAALRVGSVQEGSPAAALKFAPGDVVIAAAITDRFGRERDMRLDSLRDFAALLQQFQGRTIKLVVLRGDDDLVGTIDVRSLDAAR